MGKVLATKAEGQGIKGIDTLLSWWKPDGCGFIRSATIHEVFWFCGKIKDIGNTKTAEAIASENFSLRDDASNLQSPEAKTLTNRTLEMQKDNKINESCDELEELASNCPLGNLQENFSAAFLLQIINGTEDPIFVKDRQHRLILLNDACCNFLRVKREELIGKSDYDFFPKVEADVFWEKDELVFITGMTSENEESLTDAQGVTHFISTKKCLFKDSADNQFLVVKNVCLKIVQIINFWSLLFET